MAINLSDYSIDVIKHGSHNQSSHGRGGGASGGSGGGGSQAAKPSEDKLVEAKEALSNNIIGAQKKLNDASSVPDMDRASGAVKGFKDIKAALGDKKKMDAVRVKRNNAAAKLISGPDAVLMSDYNQNFGYVSATTGALAIYRNL